MAFAIIFRAGRRKRNLPGRIPIGRLADSAGHKESRCVALRSFKGPQGETKTLMNWVSEGLAVRLEADPCQGVAV